VEWLSNPASTGGIAMRSVWYVFIGAGAAVGIVVYGCIVWCLFRYRRRAGRSSEEFEGNGKLEALYVVIPLVMIVALFVVTYAIEAPLDRVAAASDDAAERIGVTAFQWSWRFDYGNGFVVYGTPMSPPVLYLPAGRETEIDLRSIDVTHSFWVPAFLFKRDAIPGVINRFDLTPTRTGRFAGRCAQFCGFEHAGMTFSVAVVTPRAFDRYRTSMGRLAP
jgi:cytochrome c oxidase subunit II